MTTCSYCGRPKLLDAFSGEGGAGKGYMDAGWCVDAVDNSDARLAKYPSICPAARTFNADAVAFIVDHGREYAARHASPPCTGYSRGTAAIPDRLTRYDRLIAATREALEMVGGPYVIENVEDAKHELRDPLTLCWTEFYRVGSVKDEDGTPLWMRRHRLFESNVPLMRPGGCQHPPRKRTAPGWVQCAGAYGGARRDKDEARFERKGGYVPSVTVMRELLGIDWMTEKGCQLSIPPAYTEHIGRTLLDYIESEAAA